MELNLQDIRGQLDQIDDQLIDLFSRRMRLVSDVAAYKKENGLPIVRDKRIFFLCDIGKRRRILILRLFEYEKVAGIYLQFHALPVQAGIDRRQLVGESDIHTVTVNTVDPNMLYIGRSGAPLNLVSRMIQLASGRFECDAIKRRAAVESPRSYSPDRFPYCHVLQSSAVRECI